MSDSNEHVGFSFQLSETPPPLNVSEGTPLGDLDLDFGEFSNANEDASPAALDLRNRSWVGEPEPAAAAADVATSAASPPAILDEAPSAKVEVAPSAPESPRPAAAAESVKAAPIEEPAEAAAAAELEPDSKQASAPQEVLAPIAAPRIKKIQFPVRAERAPSAPPAGKPAPTEAARSAQVRSALKPSPQKPERPLATTKAAHPPTKMAAPQAPSNDRSAESAPAPVAEPSRPKTHFSKSISAENPRARLESDGEGERSAEIHAGVHAAPPKIQGAPSPTRGGGSQVSPPRPDDQAPPEDLPSSSDPYLPQDHSAAEWGTDTPTAREIWHKARKSWQEASRQAMTLGGQGLRASQRLAVSMNGRVRESLRRAAEERQAAHQEQAARAQEEEALRATAHTAKEEDRVADFHSAASARPGPSMAGRAILGLARSASKKLAAPLSALAVAGVVYYGGTQLLTSTVVPSLSKSATGPEIPDLGTLANQKAKKAEPAAEADGSGKGPSAEKKKPEAPKEVPMQVEVTDMPEGLSWPGKGLIEVVTSEEELIYVDGVFTGRGPLRRVPVSPGKHEVSIRTESSQRSGTVEVKANRNSRAIFKSN